MRDRARRCAAGLTLVELMVVIAVVAVLLVVAAPSMRTMIEMQRLRSVHAQLVTDLQFARSEAISRRADVWVAFGSNAASTCYIVFTDTSDPAVCNCGSTAPSPCAGSAREIRTVRVDRALNVRLEGGDTGRFAFDRLNGNIKYFVRNAVFEAAGPFSARTVRPAGGTLQAVVSLAGRTTVCSPDGSVTGVPKECP